MDPFIEAQAWDDFHARFATHVAESLNAVLLPRFVAKVQRRIYLQSTPEELASRMLIPDVTVQERLRRPPASGERAVNVLEAPHTLPLPAREEQREAFVEVFAADGGELLTVIELLSPTNKTIGEGRREYLRKRDELGRSEVSLVELDLLRGGAPLPMGAPLPKGDFYLFVAPSWRRPWVGVWPVALREPLPAIPIPLRPDLPEVSLELQQLCDRLYETGGYGYSLDYDRPVQPPLPPDEDAWVRARIEAWRAVKL
jgi:hypothetical protein